MTSSYGPDVIINDEQSCEEYYDLFDSTFDEFYEAFIEKDAPEYESQVEVDYDP